MDVAVVTDVNIRDAVIWPRDQIVYKGRDLAIWGWSFHAKDVFRNRNSGKRLESQVLIAADQ